MLQKEHTKFHCVSSQQTKSPTNKYTINYKPHILEIPKKNPPTTRRLWRLGKNKNQKTKTSTFWKEAKKKKKSGALPHFLGLYPEVKHDNLYGSGSDGQLLSWPKELGIKSLGS